MFRLAAIVRMDRSLHKDEGIVQTLPCCVRRLPREKEMSVEEAEEPVGDEKDKEGGKDPAHQHAFLT